MRSTSLALLVSAAFGLVSQGTLADAPLAQKPHEANAARIAAIEAGMPPVDVSGRTEKKSLVEWMRALRVPGLSVAIIEDGKVAWARSYGVADSAKPASTLTPRTLMQAASIAKPVTAVAVMHEVGNGRLSLDADINRYLRRWKVPEASDSGPVTLRDLLAHTAGITPGGFAGYRRGEALPTLVQVLRGEAPATNVAARRVTKVGESVEYSGLAYTIVELAISEQIGQPFPKIVETAVFDPLALSDSTFAADLPPDLAMRASAGHRPDGTPLVNGWMVNPELAAAGLWTTSEDLAQLVVAVAQAWKGEATPLLSRAAAREMLAPHRERMALGFAVRPEQPGWFSHAGGNTGYRAYFEMDAATGSGVVVMTNSDVGQLLIALVVRAVAREYGRPSQAFSEATLSGIAAQLARRDIQRAEFVHTPAGLSRFVGKYELQPGLLFDIDVRNGVLGARLGDQPRFDLKADSETTFYFETVEASVTFHFGKDGVVDALVLHQGGRDMQAKRLRD